MSGFVQGFQKFGDSLRDAMFGWGGALPGEPRGVIYQPQKSFVDWSKIANASSVGAPGQMFYQKGGGGGGGSGGGGGGGSAGNTGVPRPHQIPKPAHAPKPNTNARDLRYQPFANIPMYYTWAMSGRVGKKRFSRYRKYRSKRRPSQKTFKPF